MKHEKIIIPDKLSQFLSWARRGKIDDNRLRRYILFVSANIIILWAICLIYLAVAPRYYQSNFTMILPGNGVGSSLNLESIGQASSSSTSAFSSATLSPTESYKRLLLADITMDRATEGLSDEEARTFGKPNVKLVDQTNLIEVSLDATDPKKAQIQARKLRDAFLLGLDNLRQDEAAKREASDRINIARLETKVKEAQARLFEFQGKSGLVSMDQFDSKFTAIENLKERARSLEADANGQHAASGSITSSIQSSPRMARNAMVLKGDPEFQAMLAQHADAKVRYAKASSTLGVNHPEVVEAREQVNSLAGDYRARGSKLTGMRGADVDKFADLSVTDSRSGLMGNMVMQRASASSASSSLSTVRRQLRSLKSETPELIEKAAILAELQRDLRVAEAVFSSALARLDTSKMDPFSSYPLVQILEEPTLAKSPSSPSILMTLVGAIAATIFLLIGFVILWFRPLILDKILPKG
ncbi:hypothetical protein LPB140_01175 [Sphingorhabdus lutea]|uniref:Lipopolysaccharide biosynthesis protein n=1 Tax=Sphingorhabdus lutea TaxID=1913578 RepID=A0A1L3J983_9SPHN|nr:hypothetical protein [Sphingorhabdus lutea]APG61675.1 hypothetical protein LPB140_01175 [Sphingorhabdus lutea]